MQVSMLGSLFSLQFPHMHETAFAYAALIAPNPEPKNQSHYAEQIPRRSLEDNKGLLHQYATASISP